jgi:hypothetical protein
MFTIPVSIVTLKQALARSVSNRELRYLSALGTSSTVRLMK